MMPVAPALGRIGALWMPRYQRRPLSQRAIRATASSVSHGNDPRGLADASPIMNPVDLMWLCVALAWLAAILLTLLPIECPEDCIVCRAKKADREEQARKRNDDYWNNRRRRP